MAEKQYKIKNTQSSAKGKQPMAKGKAGQIPKNTAPVVRSPRQASTNRAAKGAGTAKSRSKDIQLGRSIYSDEEMKEKVVPNKVKKKFKIKPINNILMMLALTVFQLMTFGTLFFKDGTTQIEFIEISLIYIVIEWAYVLFFRFVAQRRNFELEFIAFFLSGVGLVTLGTIAIDEVMTQFITLIAGLVLFTVMVYFMGNVELCMKLRVPIAICALGLLALNLVLAQTTMGANNWIKIGSFTVQPSEFVKIAFIFVGAATLEKIQTTKSIWIYIGFACACVGSLFLMKDFGTALIFFFTFLIIAFMQSGDIRTVIFSCAAGVLGATMIIKFKPHVTSRFKGYRHVWEYMNVSAGYQQTRVLIGMASGGLFGVGIGQGYVKNVAAARNDLVFGVICEEWGLIFGLIVVGAIAGILISALKNAVASRSTFYSIAACAAAGLMLFQTCLNIFGITDILPLTGVTLPFVSQGGSSMISCWGMLAFVKACDVRTYNYLGGAKG